MDNITTFCTNDCDTSLTSWLSTVESECANDTVTQSSIVVEAKTIPLQYTYAYSAACLQDSSENWCFFESQDWAGSDYIRYDVDMCFQADPPEICSNQSFTTAQIDPDMEAMVNLYDPTLVSHGLSVV
jgi:hypothetical protein